MIYSWMDKSNHSPVFNLDSALANVIHFPTWNPGLFISEGLNPCCSVHKIQAHSLSKVMNTLQLAGA